MAKHTGFPATSICMCAAAFMCQRCSACAILDDHAQSCSLASNKLHHALCICSKVQ